MQDRRLIYIEQDDIPASAVAWNGETTTSPSGNVLYIPNANLNSAIATILGDDILVGIFGVDSDASVVGLSNSSYNSTAVWGGTVGDYGVVNYYGGTGIMHLYQHYGPILVWDTKNYRYDGAYRLFPGPLAGNSSNLYGYSIRESESAYYGLYIKLKFRDNIKIVLFNYNESTNTQTVVSEETTARTIYPRYPIYIDTEN